MKFGTQLTDNKRLFALLPLILDCYRLCNNLKIYEFGTVLI